MSSKFPFPYFRHVLVVSVGIIAFFLLSSRQKQLIQYFQSDGSVSSTEVQLFTEAQLLQYNGKEREQLYLVILGHVYDVSKGAQNYGAGQAYHIFIGHDATRSFITGEFDHYRSELSDVSSLTEAELKQLLNWKDFYDKTYPYLGKAIGRYFDHQGEETMYYQLVMARAAKAEERKETSSTYPSCNVEWKKETGTRVWCTNRSGDGQEREWVGLPRKVLYDEKGNSDAGRGVQFCACVPENVSNTQYVPFTGCLDSAVSCMIPDQS